MYLHSLRIDRFGRHSALEFEGLTGGLQVVEGHNGAGKRTVLQFLRATFFGFDDQTRKQYLPIDSRGFGGAIRLETRFGRKIVSRFDDGSVDGRLTVEHGDGRLIGQRHLDELLSGVTVDRFDSVFGVDFARRPQIANLVRVALDAGISFADERATARLTQLQGKCRELEQQLDRLPHNLPSIEHLHEQRRRLSDEISGLKQNASNACLPEGLDELGARKGSLEQHRSQVHKDLQEIERQLTDHYHDQTARPAIRASVLSADSGEAAQLDVQIERWRSVLNEISARRQRLQHTLEEEVSRSQNAAHDPRQVLRMLEQQVHSLRTEQDRSDRRHGCHCCQLREATLEIVSTLESTIHELSDEMTRRELSAQGQDADGELHQLSRCESELQLTIRDLVERRRSLDDFRVADDRQVGCQCDDHPQQYFSTRATETLDGARAFSSEAVAEWERKRGMLRRELADADARLSEIMGRFAAAQHDSRDSLHQRIRQLRGQQRAVEEQLDNSQYRQQAVDKLVELTSEMRRLQQETSTSSLVVEASRLLHRLTGGNLQQLHLDPDHSVWVTDSTGRRLPGTRLSEGNRDFTYLALCLTIAGRLRDQGVTLPIVLLNPFAYAESRELATAVEGLSDFAVRDHQVIVFTQQPAVCTIFRAAGVPVRSLMTPQAIVEPIADRTQSTNYNVLDRRWDADEFPGELTDRVGFGTDDHEFSVGRMASADSKNGITEDSSIEDAPSMDAANAVRFRKIGVLQIRDLLSIPADEAESHLHYAGVTADMVRIWQAQSRLVCRVPHLRPYDARILVACGITDSDQLLSLSPEQLRKIVQRFLATSRGQAVLLSGSEYERSRLAEWMQGRARDGEGENDGERGSQDRNSRSSTSRSGTSGSRSRESRRRRRDRAERSRSTRNESEGTARSSQEQESESQRESRSGRTSTGRRSRRSRRERTTSQTSRTSRTSRGDDRDVLKMEETPADGQLKFYLNADDPIVDAPSIGARTAERMNAAGVRSVTDFLAADPVALAAGMGQKRITANTIREWQMQTSLASRIPQLRGHDAQILVALDVTDPKQLANAAADELWAEVKPFIATKAGKRIIRNGKEPDLNEVKEWIRWARDARSHKAA
jgi:uncharacterized protein YhaN